MRSIHQQRNQHHRRNRRRSRLDHRTSLVTPYPLSFIELSTKPQCDVEKYHPLLLSCVRLSNFSYWAVLI